MYYQPYIMHHGVLGMKWGVRHDKKKSYYAKNGKPINEAEKNAIKEAKKKEVLSSRSAKKLYDNADLFTDEELDKAYKRLNLEKNIANIADNEVSSGKKKARNASKTLITVATTATSALTLYNMFANIYNTASGENRFPTISSGKKK